MSIASQFQKCRTSPWPRSVERARAGGVAVACCVALVACSRSADRLSVVAAYERENPSEPREGALVPCDVAVGIGEEPLIDDFEDGDFLLPVRDGREGDWYAYNSEQDDLDTDDDLAGQVLEIVDDVESPTRGRVLHTAGNSYRYAGLGFVLRDTAEEDDEVLPCTYDASVYDGVRLWARGDGPLRVSFAGPDVVSISANGNCDEETMSCWDGQEVVVDLQPEWQEYFVRFDRAIAPEWVDHLGAVDPSRLRQLELKMVRPSLFDLWIDDVSFYQGDAGEAPSSVP